MSDFNSEFRLKDSCIAIVGLGLMGGSLAMALQKWQVCRRVVALVRRAEAVQEAMSARVVDLATTDSAQALAEADIVVLTTPVRVLLRQLVDLAPFYKTGAIITDMGSTKRQVVKGMAALPGQVYPIGSHPMCGKEQTGLAAAEATLYQGAPWILTPLARTPPAVGQVIEELARAIGAVPRYVEAERHDKLVASISHLPYSLAVALVLAAQTVAADDGAVWEVAASGFRDTSRLAAADITMMTDILLTNQDMVLAMIGQAQAQLTILAQAITNNDEPTMRALMEQAAKQRRVMYQKIKN